MIAPIADHGEIARLRGALRRAGGEAPAPELCPPPETIWDAVHGALPAGPTIGVVEHTAACPSCAQEWRHAKELRDASEHRSREAAAAAAAPPASWPALRRPSRTAALAALLVLAVGAGLARLQMRARPPAMRPGRGAEIRSLVSGRDLPRQAFLLRWSVPAGSGGAPAPGGDGAPAGRQPATWDLAVVTAGGQPVVRPRGLSSPEYLVPQSSLAGLPGATELRWQVKAALPDGASLASPTFHNRLR
jgi:hypothetical protein